MKCIEVECLNDDKREVLMKHSKLTSQLPTYILIRINLKMLNFYELKNNTFFSRLD